MKNDFDDLILQMRKQLNDIENEEKKSRKMIEENRVKKAKQMTLRKRKQLLKAEFHFIQRL
jgi:lipid II:glycine glycyltransferase (peptidoglycan interpeptide bridge formation enzyme)